ncbi:MAG: hypothetical protein KDA25_05285 [Phycisphaerales bacterium]|nr:hypothetical protein [Phycisphaerales bacterium]
MRPAIIAVLALTSGMIAAPALAGGNDFFDDFSSRPSPLWGNEFGNWTASGGVYSAAVSSNFPNSYSSLPFEFESFVLDLDINDVADGGVWLRSEPAPGTPIGIKGVLLVTGAGNNSFYWHIVPTGDSYGPSLLPVSGLFNDGDDISLHIVVSGNTYDVYLNGSGTPATSLTTDAFTVGGIALYDYSNQTFDNVNLDGVLACPQDLNDDDTVGPADLAVLLGQWGACVDCAADFDDDDTVGPADLAVLLGAWGDC